jgi:hypothetical protein
MPKCAFANVVLWNRYLQTFDFGRETSLNRKQMKVNDDSSFKVILAHQKPKPKPASASSDSSIGAENYNYLDTMGRSGGTVFWRFLLPEGKVRRPTATVVKFDSL